MLGGGGDMSRAVVSVASDSWTVGQARLLSQLRAQGEQFEAWINQLPAGCPPHRTRGVLGAPQEQCVPYAFKAYALKEAVVRGHSTLMWADACILPIKDLTPLWERIERDGYWFARNGYRNDEWTADSAYEDLFNWPVGGEPNPSLEDMRQLNRDIQHVVGTCFGISTAHPLGHMFLEEYYRLASTTKAFCGPWQNSNAPMVAGRNSDRYAAPCGPPTTLGHRHDQSAASVIAWRLGFKLSDPPEIFCYVGGEDESTLLIADGVY